MPLLKGFMEMFNIMGKYLKKFIASKSIKEIRKLKEQLNVCIKNEEYEKAAQIRTK